MHGFFVFSFFSFNDDTPDFRACLPTILKHWSSKITGSFWMTDAVLLFIVFVWLW